MVDSVAEQSSGTLACGGGTGPVPDCGREADGDTLALTCGCGNMQAVVVQGIEAMGHEAAACRLCLAMRRRRPRRCRRR